MGPQSGRVGTCSGGEARDEADSNNHVMESPEWGESWREVEREIAEIDLGWGGGLGDVGGWERGRSGSTLWG